MAWRSLGKQVGLTPSGVRIPYPPRVEGPQCFSGAFSAEGGAHSTDPRQERGRPRPSDGSPGRSSAL